jgi:hypothetical protein
VIWGIWLSRNEMIFQGLELSPAQVAHKIRSTCNGNWSSSKTKPARILKEPEIDYDQAWGFFDGTCQGVPSLCGVGVILFPDQCHHFKLS